MGMRAAIYLRVSTARQADKDLSIPDQRRTVTEHCQRNGWTIVSEYVEPGRSARDDNRPDFRRMIADAIRPEHPFDVIVVHSFSRFFRDEVHQELNIRRLQDHQVTVQSATEELGEGLGGETTRRILGIIAEMENRQRAARVVQTMQENARQGYWNGGPPPFGYRSFVAEMRGDTAKKRLELDPREAEIARLIFRLCLQGAGKGPMGVKAIVEHLNAKELRYRRGRLFRTNEVHRILTSSTYSGAHYYNRRIGKTRKLKDPSEWIAIEVPAIIEPDTFEAVKRHLHSRRPTVTPARLTNGAMLLSQIARCPHCGSGMTLRTGKGGRYRYYTCSQAATKGRKACPGRSIRMNALDEMVVRALEERLFTPERVQEILAKLAQRVLDRQSQSQERAKELRRELRTIETAVNRLYDAVEKGLVDDDDLFRRRLSDHKQRRDELIRLIAHNRRRGELSKNLLTRRNCAAFARAVRAKLRDPLSANITETPATFGISVGRWR